MWSSASCSELPEIFLTDNHLNIEDLGWGWIVQGLQLPEVWQGAQINISRVNWRRQNYQRGCAGGYAGFCGGAARKFFWQNHIALFLDCTSVHSTTVFRSSFWCFKSVNLCISVLCTQQRWQTVSYAVAVAWCCWEQGCKIQASCCFCNKSFPDGSATDFEAHLTDSAKVCKAKEYTSELRDQVVNHILKRAVSVDSPVTSELSRKARKTAAHHTPLTATFDNSKLPEHRQKLFGTKLLWWLVMSGISFAAVQSPFFLAFMRSVRQSYIPAGKSLIPFQTPQCQC